jgi:hypothetical protein
MLTPAGILGYDNASKQVRTPLVASRAAIRLEN